jgi:hypothetical protein
VPLEGWLQISLLQAIKECNKAREEINSQDVCNTDPAFFGNVRDPKKAEV